MLTSDLRAEVQHPRFTLVAPVSRSRDPTQDLPSISRLKAYSRSSAAFRLRSARELALLCNDGRWMAQTERAIYARITVRQLICPDA